MKRRADGVGRLVAALAGVAGLMLMSLSVAAGNAVENARLWPAPDHTRLVFDLESGVEHRVFSLENPRRLVIDIENVRLAAQLSGLELDGSPIRRIRSAPRNGDDLRVVLDLDDAIEPRSFELEPNQKYGHRLVVDLMNKNQSPDRAAGQPVISRDDSGKRDIVVVIDAGHGGEDPGAIGPSGTHEKDVVLELAKRLKNRIERAEGYTARLTRTGDYYIGLRKRTVLAREHKADLFISVHADAFRTSAPRGASVFALSRSGATSETAKWLARRENRSDLIGGAGSLSLKDKDDTLAGVLLDLSMTASINASVGVGDDILDSLDHVTRLHKSGVEQAAFAVLKSPDIPSILVEAGFISNPEEERKLQRATYQNKLAEAVFSGVESYFRRSPPPGTLLAWRQNQGGGTDSYRVRRGDTLSDLARRNSTTVNQIKQLNGLSSDQVVVGQTLKIPAS
ncbi:N-acetylmuramoyl-L-alanine amidase [Tamilnaduibacter salinus]|uniref:N-acetylmuramoyl-L-alanine amidase AmiC n=1 Tax=Tamilnaduibacter salinus TaxID=1484056 RepID=A0A2A2I476_9GAMM|nr:N-acetylmuramoyl-L-alanine amidase [Tamilnaduibacter salinus]PAV26467.1 N-acetylmuramoyl-L-alanine amidase [Tamilnaduibacter salinus]